MTYCTAHYERTGEKREAKSPKHLRIWFPKLANQRTLEHWEHCFERHVKYAHNGKEKADCPACKELRERANA